MSSPGFNPLAIVAPDLYAKQIAIQRQQALAQSLLQQGESNPGSAQFGGLRNAGNMLLGAFLAKRGDQSMANLYAPQPDTAQTTSQPSGQVSNAPTPMPQGSPDAVPLSAQSGPTPQISNAPSQQPANVAMGQALTGRPKTIPQAMGGAIPDLPGLTHQQSLINYFQDPGGYWKSLAAVNGPTDLEKNAAAAYGRGTPEYDQVIKGTLDKGGSINTTRGVTILPDGRKIYAPPPAPAGYQNQSGPDGQLQVTPSQGGPQAVAGSALAAKVPGALLSPATGYEQQKMPDGTMAWMPKQSNALEMSGNSSLAGQLGIGQQTPNIDRNNPLNVSPGGQVSTYQNSTAGLGAAWDNLSAYGRRGINTVAGVMNTWAPVTDNNGRTINPNTPQNIAMISQKLGVRPDQPLNMSDPNVKGQLIELMRPTETGNRYAPPAQSAAALPELPPGVAAGSQRMANNAADQATGQNSDWGQTHAMATDVPTRLNVLQSIVKLSQAGAPTGSTEWMNEARDTAAALSQALGHPISANNPAALMTEIQKYMGQYSNRMAQGQGGTGTDKQLDAVQHANPNSDMFASTLQRVVPWIMANERGIAAKANFLDAQPGAMNDAKSQLAAQNAWRNIYSPRIAQFEMMNPQQQAGYLNDPHAFRDKADRQQFIQSAMKLHPYFAQGR